MKAPLLQIPLVICGTYALLMTIAGCEPDNSSERKPAINGDFDDRDIADNQRVDDKSSPIESFEYRYGDGEILPIALTALVHDTALSDDSKRLGVLRYFSQLGARLQGMTLYDLNCKSLVDTGHLPKWLIRRNRVNASRVRFGPWPYSDNTVLVYVSHALVQEPYCSVCIAVEFDKKIARKHIDQLEKSFGIVNDDDESGRVVGISVIDRTKTLGIPDSSYIVEEEQR